jgi:hypothetical protein
MKNGRLCSNQSSLRGYVLQLLRDGKLRREECMFL